MPPLGCPTNTITTDEVAISVTAVTPYNEVVKQLSSSLLLTQNTCETTINSIGTVASDTTTSDTVGSSDNHHSVTNTTTTAASTTTTTMDSPEPKQQPRRNLTKAFEALCITTSTSSEHHHHHHDDETSKEEKLDAFDDHHHRHLIHSSKTATLVSPISVVPMTQLELTSMNHTTNEAAAATTAPVNAIISSIPPNQDDTPGDHATATVPYSSGLTAVIVPDLNLHTDLRLKLSLYTIERVACYSIVHDINKEAATMALQDPLLQQQSTETDSVSPLVLEGRGGCNGQQQAPMNTASVPVTETHNMIDYAVIDEEKWILASIANRSSQETATNTSTQCPATFLQAMGEKEYDLITTTTTTTAPTTTTNHHHNNNNSSSTNVTTTSTVTRTQLWKPSRSWWEAKSGKNPWIEPSSHNKRWRYLWPLIHYHKFVHKCIKKLKRNGVDVKVSVSPVSVFLREEVCAVSDHLAAVSLFGSEEWMDCLGHFNGWTDINSTESILQYQLFVQSLPLRSLQDPVDVDSPLLRNQIDEVFLRMIAMQRDSSGLTYHAQNNASSVASTKITRNQPGTTTATTNTSATGATTTNGGPPPMHPHTMAHLHHVYQHNSLPVPRQINGVRRSRYVPNGWYQGHVHPGWENLPIDASSVHSELSANSYPQPSTIHHSYIDTATVAAQAAHYHMYPSTGAMYYAPVHAVSSPCRSAATYGQSGQSDTSHSAGYAYPDQYGGWMDPTTMAAYAMHQQHYYPSPAHFYGIDEPSPLTHPPVSTSANTLIDEKQHESSESEGTEANESTSETPYKYNLDQSYMMQSPNWSHLDQATLAMGLATPAMTSPASTPRRTTLMSGNSLTTTTVKKQNQSLHSKCVAEEEASITGTMTENDDEYPITENNPYVVGPIYPGQRHYHTSNLESTKFMSHTNHYSTFDDHSTAAATLRNAVVPPSPATQFMMSPKANFAYSYGYGVSPARIPPRSVNRQRFSSAGSASTAASSLGLTNAVSTTKYNGNDNTHTNIAVPNKTSTGVDAMESSSNLVESLQ